MKYLYNGHRAPGLPVYDPGELPYGLIVSSNADNTALILMLCVNRPYYGTNPEDSTKTGVYNIGRMKVYTCTDTDEAWTFSTETENPLTANDDDPGGGVLWTLEDILKTDGSVWMAGTQPVPERVSEAWVRSFQEGLALGLVGAPLPYTGTEPAPEPEPEAVAYLYGTPSESGSVAIAEGGGYVRYKGAVLPPLPETAYQYAVIGVYYPGGGTHGHMLSCTNLPLRDGSFMLSKPEGCVGFSYMYYEDDEDYEDWHLSEDWEDGKPFLLPANPIWANYDLMNYAGTAVVMTASAPVPLASAEHTEAVYGSTRLPVFPDYNAEKYPYAILLRERDFTTEVPKNYYTLHVFDRRVTLEGYSYSPIGEYVASSFVCFSEYYNSTGWASVHLDVSNPHWQPGSKSLYLWSNFDFMKEDGSVVIATSPDPVPVYEQRKE